jgi:hypothetical protein
MIRTYRICQAPGHRHPESLRGILRRLERDIANEPPRVEALGSLRAPGTGRRLTF